MLEQLSDCNMDGLYKSVVLDGDSFGSMLMEDRDFPVGGQSEAGLPLGKLLLY